MLLSLLNKLRGGQQAPDFASVSVVVLHSLHLILLIVSAVLTL